MAGKAGHFPEVGDTAMVVGGGFGSGRAGWARLVCVALDSAEACGVRVWSWMVSMRRGGGCSGGACVFSFWAILLTDLPVRLCVRLTLSFWCLLTCFPCFTGGCCTCSLPSLSLRPSPWRTCVHASQVAVERSCCRGYAASVRGGRGDGHRGRHLYYPPVESSQQRCLTAAPPGQVESEEGGWMSMAG